jgi:hypothetical protein
MQSNPVMPKNYPGLNTPASLVIKMPPIRPERGGGAIVSFKGQRFWRRPIAPLAFAPLAYR